MKGETAIFYAAKKPKNENYECFRLLATKFKADVFIKNKNGENLKDICDKFNNMQCKDLLRTKLDKRINSNYDNYCRFFS